jgi:ABC-type multidrug transport system ATPase subunit
MRILATVTRPTEGTVTWNGSDILQSPDQLRSVLGYLPQDFGVYPHLNAVEFLQYIAAVKGLNGQSARERIHQLLDMVGLFDVRQRPLGGYSGGMKQRVGIAQAMLNDPRLLIVDEPTAGLDPAERVRFRNLLCDLGADRIVILSTHIVSDIEASATEIAVLNLGQLLMHGTPEQLLRSVQGKVWECVVPSSHLASLRQNQLVSSAVHRSDGVTARLITNRPPGADAMPVTPTLEDAYLHEISDRRSVDKPWAPCTT